MTARSVPRLALAILERCVPDSAPLAGDLIEEFEARRSRAWFWWQAMAAIATAWLSQPAEIRPLRLGDAQPFDALERSRRWNRRRSSINPTASPIHGIGGLGLLVLAVLVSVVMPMAWWLLAAAALSGVVCGIVLVAAHRQASKPALTIQPH